MNSCCDNGWNVVKLQGCNVPGIVDTILNNFQTFQLYNFPTIEIITFAAYSLFHEEYRFNR